MCGRALAIMPPRPCTLAAVTVERRKPAEPPTDSTASAEVQAADDEARKEAAERSSELLERLRKL